jgi:hypothetical protein
MFPSLQHFGGRRACWTFGMGTRKSDKHQLFTWTWANQTISWLVLSLSTFGAWTNQWQTRTNHGQTWTHKTHHGPNLGEATTFPFIVHYVPGHRANTQMSFCCGTPKWEFRNSQIEIPTTLEAHNFVCRPLIEVRSK